MLSNLFKTIFNYNYYYVQIWTDKISVRSIDSDAIYVDIPLVAIKTGSNNKKSIVAIGREAKDVHAPDIDTINPFAHPRVLMADFGVAEELLKYLYRKVSQNQFFTPSPIAIIHLHEKIEGGITGMEAKAFREAAEGAGARHVYIYTGKELREGDFNRESLEKMCI